ncbi:cyclophilin-like fold protein [Treponema pedis]|uniref:Putative lipoprotein n=1 Tax=Treponema pedis str. T A4 TaxID=1291379 RepID=S5ZZU4_9SPIR|nr:cyclophilin-like fold protein [Treponema pedis]AGT43873.1 putative lipoprotein [Treponema pedis str. T A4]
MKKFFIILAAFFLCISAAFTLGTKTDEAFKSVKHAASTQGVNDMKISITITSESGKHTLTAALSDNSSAAAFYELLKKNTITVNMQDYGNFEKVGRLPQSLPHNDMQITTSAGDIILYQGNKITVYYDVNSWNFTLLGKIDGITQAELKKILGTGDITAVFAVLK